MQLSDKEIKDLNTLAKFIEIYCNSKHQNFNLKSVNKADKLHIDLKSEYHLCPDCIELLNYSADKRIKCPLTPKPPCNKCNVRCYSDSYREKIREIMKYSGKKMILKGRFDYILRYLTTRNG
ncbi:MAG: nitrous oxide-stimulated promoter family protein [Desulfuromonadales bacterium]|nr:nitrous oxide-stimulated promoter family protein [Desulfuromonadales bacterium]